MTPRNPYHAKPSRLALRALLLLILAGGIAACLILGVTR